MTVAIQSGFTLTDGKHARILHKRNSLPIKTVVTSDEVTGYEGINATRGDTVDRWRPFANAITDSMDFSLWTPLNVTVAADGQTVSETSATGIHSLTRSFALSGNEQVFAVKVSRKTIPELQLFVFDGAFAFTCYFDLRDKTVGASVGSVGKLVDLGGGEMLLLMVFTPAAASCSFQIRCSNGSENTNFTGDTSSSVKLLQAYTHESEATLTLETFTALEADVFAIAAHNLWSSGATITFEHDSNNDGTFTTLGTATPTDDSPIMFLFDSVTSGDWRIGVSGGALPEIGVARVGAPLILERPFYGGFSPARMNRSTEVRGNISGNGALLGRSKRRTILSANYQWQNLTEAWVRANLDGPNGLIQSLEDDTAFIAWRPALLQDCDYIMRGQASPPQAQGTRDLWSFSMSGEVFSYE